MNIGDLIAGQYEVIDLLPNGNQADVVVVRDRQTGESLVIKRMSTPPSAGHYAAERDRFLRAAQLRFGHPHVLDPLGLLEENGELYLLLPYIQGNDLEHHVIRCGGKLPSQEAPRLVRQIADGLSVVHAQGVVHRDIKPANLLVRQDGHVFLLDFGIAHLIGQQTITQNAGLFGSLNWMSPEQTRDARQVDPRSDLYALGTVLYWMLTGTSAVRGQNTKEVVEYIHLTLPPAPQSLDAAIPGYLDQICMKLLQKQPDARFQNAADLMRAIDAAGQVSPDLQTCRACGCQPNVSAKFCPNCGHSFQPVAIITVCLQCGSAAGNAPACPACRQTFSPANHRMEIRSGPGTGTICRFPEGIYEVGRNQICPRDQYISRRQFKIASLNGAVYLQNISTTNLTTINGQPAHQPVLLQPGQELGFGMTRAVYSSL